MPLTCSKSLYGRAVNAISVRIADLWQCDGRIHLMSEPRKILYA